VSRDWRLYLDDMREACERIVRYLGDLDKAAFVADEKTYDAVLRNLEVLGEACKQIPPEVRSNHPDVEWRKVAGLRDIIAHAYFGVDHEILWDIVRNKVPPLLDVIKRIGAEPGGGTQ
jgi:uncharacterized protein with HEPN domain